MGKRSNFERREKDNYPTPFEAVKPLLPFLRRTKFIEPCCGDGDLIKHLESAGHECVAATDIRFNSEFDATTFDFKGMIWTLQPLCFITNPPWDRKILHPMITNLRRQMPVWLLLDADWMHTKQAYEHLLFCHAIVSVGRVKWIPDSKMTGKENCCWYLFDKIQYEPYKCTFWPRGMWNGQPNYQESGSADETV